MPEPVVVTRWKHAEAPNDELLEATLRREGLAPQWWSNDPSDFYASHAHSYHKVLYCAAGSITFILTPTGERLEIHAGDRLDIPPGWPHSAIVARTECAASKAHANQILDPAENVTGTPAIQDRFALPAHCRSAIRVVPTVHIHNSPGVR